MASTSLVQSEDRVALQADARPLGARLTMPLLLIQGEEDRVTPAAANAELLASTVPDATLVMPPSCGHLPEAEAPARVNELIEQHLCAG
jgi:pimeloyl-ACP methyl ester carboxylesterase